MNCPNCASRVIVKDSRYSEGEIRRRRHCAQCGHHFNTKETLELDGPREGTPVEITEEILYDTARALYRMAVLGLPHLAARELVDRMREPQADDLVFETTSFRAHPVGVYVGAHLHKGDKVVRVRRLDGRYENWGNSQWIAFRGPGIE